MKPPDVPPDVPLEHRVNVSLLVQKKTTFQPTITLLLSQFTTWLLAKVLAVLACVPVLATQAYLYVTRPQFSMAPERSQRLLSTSAEASQTVRV